MGCWQSMLRSIVRGRSGGKGAGGGQGAPERFDLDPGRQMQPPIDYDFGRMGGDEITAWMAARGLESVIPISTRRPAAGAEAQGREGRAKALAPTLNYQFKPWHADQLKDWAPFMEDEFASVEVRDLWTRVDNITSPKDLAGLAPTSWGAHVLPEAWPRAQKRHLQPFWQAYQVRGFFVLRAFGNHRRVWDRACF